MTLLLNWFIPGLLLVSAIIAMLILNSKHDDIKKKVIQLLVLVTFTAIMLYIYNGLNTTYLPKGSPNKLPPVTFETKDLQIKDSTTKPQEREFGDYLTVREEVQEVLK